MEKEFMGLDEKKNNDTEKLVIPKNTIAVLEKYKFVFQKKYGQNFLIDAHVLDKIIRGSNITKEDTVLEVGPGIGTMTQYLAESAKKVVAVEIDRNLIPILRDTLSAYDNVEIIHGDILNINLEEILGEELAAGRVKVVANLPYYITTPIIMGMFESDVPIKSMTVMVQREVARRMECEPGSKEYGALSLAVQYYAEPYIIANVPPNCFMPRPGVGSAVIRLTRHEKPPVNVADEKMLFNIIRASFNQRRKTLVNGLKNASFLEYSRKEAECALKEIGKDINIRGEALSLPEFAALTNILCRHN